MSIIQDTKQKNEQKAPRHTLDYSAQEVYEALTFLQIPSFIQAHNAEIANALKRWDPNNEDKEYKGLELLEYVVECGYGNETPGGDKRLYALLLWQDAAANRHWITWIIKEAVKKGYKDPKGKYLKAGSDAADAEGLTQLELAVMVADQNPGIKYLAESGKTDIWLWHKGDRYIKGAEGAQLVRRVVTEAIVENMPRAKHTSAFKRGVLTECKDKVEIVKTAELDANGYLICFQNGYIDATKIADDGLPSETIAPGPEHLVTKLMGCDYPVEIIKRGGNPSLGDVAPRFNDFLNDIYCGNQGLIDYEQLRGGYDLLGISDEHNLHILCGSGANGKSTLLRVLLSLFGDYGRTFRSKLICGKEDNDTFGAANLQGVRLAVIPELRGSGGLNPDKFKPLTGGDWIEGEVKFQSAFNFKPFASVLVSANQMPALQSVDYATKRRVKKIPFDNTFEGEEQTKDLDRKLIAEEAAGIIYFYLVGLMRYMRGELLIVPDAVAESTDDYISEQDIVSQWVNDNCVLDAQARPKAKDLYADFKAYSESEGVRNPLTRGKLLNRLKQDHDVINDSKKRGGAEWVGIRLDNDD